MHTPVPLSTLQASPLAQFNQQVCRVRCSAPRTVRRRLATKAQSQHNEDCHSPQPDRGQGVQHQIVSRRALLATAGTAAVLSGWAVPATAIAATPPDISPHLPQQLVEFLESPLDYSAPGPLGIARLPRLETVCHSCSTVCAGTNCLIRIDVTYPKGGAALGLQHPYPLAIFSSGFMVASDMYRSYAERLASWGYTVILYDRLESIGDSLDDVTSVTALRHIMDWAGTHPLVSQVADASSVYLLGHSRGGKLSALAASVDHRVAAVCLLDPVDNTVYAPIAPGYPSAVAALRNQCGGSSMSATNTAATAPRDTSLIAAATQAGPQPSRAAPLAAAFASPAAVLAAAASAARLSAGPAHAATSDAPAAVAQPPAAISTAPHPAALEVHNCAAPNVLGGVPVAIVGSGIGGDCAPKESNYQHFFDAAPGPTWEVSIPAAGHFEYLDPLSSPTTSLQRALCPTGQVSDTVVRQMAQTVMVAWGELMIRKRDPSLLLRPAREAYFSPSTPTPTPTPTPAATTASLPLAASAPPAAYWAATGGVAGGDVGALSLTRYAMAETAAGAPRQTAITPAEAALERLTTMMRYEAGGPDVVTRYKNL